MRNASAVSVARVRVGLEEGPDGSTLVHSLDVPGCVASGRTRPESLAAFERELARWLTFLGDAAVVTSRAGELDIVVEEWITTDANVFAGESNVCFDADRVPLGVSELAEGIRRLGSLRGRLVPRIRRARDIDLEVRGPSGYSARLILDELARAQWWTLTRLGASPLAEIPTRVVARLDTAMALTVQQLGHLTADARGQVLLIDDEEWSPRKVLRRLLWLEWTLGQAALLALGEQPAGLR
jgi:hypothetical protein